LIVRFVSRDSFHQQSPYLLLCVNPYLKPCQTVQLQDLKSRHYLDIHPLNNVQSFITRAGQRYKGININVNKLGTIA